MEKLYVISGLNLSYPDLTSGRSIDCIQINPGKIIYLKEIKKFKEYYFNNKKILNIETNNTNNFKLYSVYLSSNPIDNNLNFFYKEINLENLETTDEENKEFFFIGFIYVPALFPAVNKKIYFRSLNEKSDDVSLINSSSDFYFNLIEKIEIWQPDVLFLKNQIIRYNNSIYYALVTHFSNMDFMNDFNKNYWQLVSSGGGENNFNLDLFNYKIEKIYNRNYLFIELKIPDENNQIINRVILSKNV